MATRNNWINSIETVVNYFKKLRKSLPKKVEFDKMDKTRSWRWQEANQEEVKIIRM